MVLQVAEELALAVLPGAQQAAVLVAQALPEETRPRSGGRYEVGALKDGAGIGEGGDRERVPRGDPLVVEAGPDPLRAVLVERGSRGVDPRRRGCLGAARKVEDVLALEVAPRRSRPSRRPDRPPPPARPAAPEDFAQLVLGPDVEEALLALGVGVERRVEAALRTAHLAQHPVERALAGLAPALVARAPESRGGRRGRGARCRRASSRSAARASARRPSSGRSRRRPGRRCRRRASRRGHVPTTSRSPRASRNSTAEAGGNFGAPPNPPFTGSAFDHGSRCASSRSAGETSRRPGSISAGRRQALADALGLLRDLGALRRPTTRRPPP